MAGFLTRSWLRGLVVLLVCIVVALLDGCNSVGGGGDGTIPPFTFYAAVAVADFNGDGLPDIATCYSLIAGAPPHPGSVAVYLQNPVRPGAFLRPAIYGVGNDPNSIAVGDLDGDGKVDMVTANMLLNGKTGTRSSNVSVLLQDPAKPGQFLMSTNYATGPDPVFVTIGDLNGDGKSDLAVADSSGVSLLLQDPNVTGRFQPRTTLALGNAASSVAIADLNGDTRLDLVAATSSNVVVFLQEPAVPGEFLSPTSYGAGLQPKSVAVADLNGDNRPDLAVANLGSPSNGATASLSVLLQNPAIAGSYLAATDYKTGVESFAIVIADLNGDGNNDVAVANTGALAGICPPTCNISGGGVSVFLQSPSTPGHFLAAANYSSDHQVLSVAVADMNGDGRPDLVIANDSGVVIRFQDPANPGQFLSPKAITE
jgi:hypothetical protein